MSNSKQFDVIIVGAGLAGATLACGLGSSSLRIAVLDRNPAPAIPSGDYDLRVSSLNRGSENILRQIEAWQFIDSSRAYAYDKVEVCQQQGSSTLTFDSTEIGEPYMGHMIENTNVVHALMQRIKQLDNVEFIDGITICGLSVHDSHAELETDQGTISTKLLVGADGPLSFIRKSAGFEEIQGFYGQKCIVGTVHFDGDHQQTAWQRFLPTGPLGILPLAPGYCSLAWSCENEFADERLQESEQDFIESLEHALNGHLGNVLAMAKRVSYPLTHMHPQRYISQRIALIGDAAHTIHPLAGLGANLGITDAAALAQTLSKQSQQKSFDPGQHETLRRYERWRKPQNQIFLSTMSGLNMLFSKNLDSISNLRSLGLSIADKFTTAKKLLMQRAMGLDADQPNLLNLH